MIVFYLPKFVDLPEYDGPALNYSKRETNSPEACLRLPLSNMSPTKPFESIVIGS
jgi:hypothetical protein